MTDSRAKNRVNDPLELCKVGSVGDTVFYLHEEWIHARWNYHGRGVGFTFVARSIIDDRDYYYVVKEIRDGWWKLEWPD